MEHGLRPRRRTRPGPSPPRSRLVWIYPDLLSTYGDRGNLLVLARRARLRGVPVEIAEVNSDQQVPTDGDIYLLGGGEDLPQILAARRLRAGGGLSAAVNRGAVVSRSAPATRSSAPNSAAWKASRCRASACWTSAAAAASAAAWARSPPTSTPCWACSA